MMLYNKPFGEIAYCLVDTPDELLEYENNNYTLHHVDDIEMQLRITKICFERCHEKEELIKTKIIEARKYATWYEQQIINTRTMVIFKVCVAFVFNLCCNYTFLIPVYNCIKVGILVWSLGN